MNKITVGTCSQCGGRVATPKVWMGIKPPRPTCEDCGAVAKSDYGPTIPMEPSKGLGSVR